MSGNASVAKGWMGMKNGWKEHRNSLTN